MRLFAIAVLLLISQWVCAQGIGLHHPSEQWQQIDTDTVRVIFPAGYEVQAQRATNLIHALQRNHRRSIGDQFYKFDLVLQLDNTIPNAYVGLAPFRSEFFTTPPQSFNQLGTTNWLDLLTIHEFRHVQQNSNERRGITNLFSILQGQLGWAVFSNIATPNWFAEGDAVVLETALTNSGRGRLPAFTRGVRAIELAGIRHPYSKIRNGSFRDRIPDHYPYGYLYNTYARTKFGNDIWKGVLADAGAYKPLFYPFSGALKKHTGLSTIELYNKTLDELSNKQKTELAGRNLVTTIPVSPEHTAPYQYFFPHPQADGSVIAYRSTFRRTPELVRLTASGKVNVLTDIGIQREAYLDVQDELAVWTELRQHPRYTNRNYSDIILYEIKSGRKRKLSKEGKYLSPTLSADRSKLVAVHYDPASGAQLVVLNTVTGAEEKRLPNPDGYYLSWPNLSVDGTTIYALASLNGQIAIVSQNVTGQDKPQIVAPFDFVVKDMMTIGPDDELYYSSGLDGLDNIYAYQPKTQKTRRLTSVATGAYYPGVGPDGRMVFSETNVKGHQLSQNEQAGQSVELDLPTMAQTHFLTAALAWEAEGGNILDQQFQDTFPSQNFSNTLGGLKIHSWSFNGSYVTPGLEVVANNALNTVSVTADASYNINEKRTGGGLSVAYGGLYPVLNLSARYRERSFLVQDASFADSLVFSRQSFNQLALGGGFAIPWQWVNGNYQTQLQPRIDYSHLQLNGQTGDGVEIPSAFSSLGFGVQFAAIHRLARQHVQPRLGLSASLRFDRVLGSITQGQRFRWRSSAFLPGILRTHGVRVDLDFQREQLSRPYQYPDGMRYVRGYNAPLNDQAYRLGFNYQFPLWYPDLGVAGITYFQRIRVNAFYDMGSFSLDSIDRIFTMSSSGAEVFFDNRWLNAQDITIGLQLAYLLEPDLFASDANRLQLQLLVEGSF